MDCVQGRRNNSNVNCEKTADKFKQEVLPVTRLRFTRDQLQTLNYHYTKTLETVAESPSTQAESIVERLTQRLICAVGNLDPRFSTKFLITLHDQNIGCPNLEYLVRLDTLSTPTLYSSDVKPACEILECDNEGTASGFARIRLRNKTSTTWAEFINVSGYLRRDKVQERFVELLALAAAGIWPATPLDVDESTLCAAPGKLLDAATHHHVLYQPPEERLFYGTAANNLRFPDPRDFRLAIVDEPAGVRLRVGFLSPSFAGRDIDVRLLIAIGVDAWPQSSNFPGRVPLGHAECLLFHRASEMGMFLVACGVQSTNWQIQLPASEVTLLNHYGPTSTPSLVLKILYTALHEIHSHVNEDKCKYAYKLLTWRCMRESLWHELEQDDSSPLSVLTRWSTCQTSLHVLRILDRLVSCLRLQTKPSYFFPQCNTLSNPGYLCEEDYLVEANRVHTYLVKLHDISMSPIQNEEAITKMRMYEELDLTLITKWNDVVNGLIPPAATRSSRFSFAAGKPREVAYTQYTHRQLDYIGLLLKSMLNVKQNTVQYNGELHDEDNFSLPEDPIEDIIYLLVTIIEQARNHTNFTAKSKYRAKTRCQYDTATAKLVEAVRKDKRKNSIITCCDIQDDTVLVKIVLRWLYKGLDSKHSLAPILRPYLNKLFLTSHEVSWHLESIKQAEALAEMTALGAFCRLVNNGELSPALGLVDAVNKGWIWARDMLRLVERSSLRVLFIPDRGKVHRHILSLPSYEKTPSPTSIDDVRNIGTLLPTPKVERKFYTFFRGGNLSSHPARIDTVISHAELKQVSPMTETFKLTHRQGLHRCSGDLVQSLVALHKISVLQELSLILPTCDRHQMLDTIQKLCKENKRLVALRRRCTLPPALSQSAPTNIPNTKISRKQTVLAPLQTYTPTMELPRPTTIIDPSTSAKQQRVLREREKALAQKINKDTTSSTSSASTSTLIGSCRAARIKEDSRTLIFHENFRVKGLFTNDNFNL